MERFALTGHTIAKTPGTGQPLIVQNRRLADAQSCQMIPPR